MSKKNISDIPSFQKLLKDINNFDAFKKSWPLLKPIFKVLGVEVSSIEEAFLKIDKLKDKTTDLTQIPDKFNDVFGDRGWILGERSLNLNSAKEALEIAEEKGVDEAEEYLSEYYSPQWVEDRMNWLKFIKGFEPRIELAEKALEDYKAGRFYSSILVTLTLIDGWVNDLNIVEFQRLGFFAEKSELIAHDSITAHEKGLVKLQQVFSKTRGQTRTEEITIPYRHGILHGMDLGYDNQIVAAKCWAALFAVRDWATKAGRGELQAPKELKKKDKTLLESIQSYKKTLAETEKVKQWKPRKIKIGRDIPEFGKINDYPIGSPERKMVEFMELWKAKNYGYLASKAYSPMLEMTPIHAKENLKHMEIQDYKLTEITDISPTISDATVWINMVRTEKEVEVFYKFRVICSGKNGELVFLEKEETVWGISTWGNA